MDRFESDVSKWAFKVERQEEWYIKELSARLLEKLVQVTPHDTGTTKGNWRARRNKPPRKPLVATAGKRRDKTGAVTIRRARRALEKVQSGDSVYLVNRWYVATIINKNPHGWISHGGGPIRMVDMTLQEGPAISARVIAEAKRK